MRDTVNARYLSIPVMIALVTVPLMHFDVASAEEMRFGVYETGSVPESMYTGPLIDSTVDFEITSDLKLRLPAGTELSSSKAYMRMDSNGEVPYRVVVRASGMDGFLADSGLVFEFSDGSEGDPFRVSVDRNGQGTSGAVFLSNRNYHIRITTAEEVVTDRVPDKIEGIRISIDVTADDVGPENDDIPADSGKRSFTSGYLRNMLSEDGVLAFSIGGCGMIFDRKAADFITGKAAESFDADVTRTSSPDGTVFMVVNLKTDGDDMGDLNGGSVRISANVTSGKAISDVTVFSIDDDGTKTECESVFDSSSGKVYFTSGNCRMFAIEPIEKGTEEDHDDGTNGLLIGLPVAAIAAMIALPIILRLRGKI